MNKSFISLFFLCFFILFSCKKKKKETAIEYNAGKLTVVTDESFESVVNALTNGYVLSYPKTEIDVKVQKEDLALLDFLNRKNKVIVMSRELSDQEMSAYKEHVNEEFLPAPFAADAVLFVVLKDSERSSVGYDEIFRELNSKEKRIIFDGSNSSNLNFVAQSLGKKPADLKYSVISGNENVIEQLAKHPGRIGVVSLNTLSRPYDKKSQELRDKVKVLAVEKDGKVFKPSVTNLKAMEYPFTRVLYFLTNEGGFNIANGFVRFSCTQLGQIIVEKEGLQPYYIFEREVQMN